MTAPAPFAGSILDGTLLELGEGPTFDPVSGTAWWFNILGRELHELHVATGRKNVHSLPVMGSVLTAIDTQRQLLASDEGLFIREIATGALTPHAALEPGNTHTRSNDGRVHPSGALWIGTMGRKAEDGAGAIYHVASGTVTKLYPEISIPNSICFSPDGRTGYFTDTRSGKLMHVALDPATGLPRDKATVLVDGSGRNGGFDGSVCDAEGTIWNARWGAAVLDRYDANGTLIASFSVPARQVTCPAFIGPDASRLLVTSAWEGMDDTARDADKLAGATFEMGFSVKGIAEHAYRP